MYLFGFVFRFPDDVSQVRTFEAHPEHILLAEMQLLLNVGDHLGRCRCSQREDRHVRQQFAELMYLQVSRTEVISPLRDAVRLVHRDKADVHLPEFGLEQLCPQSFRGDVEELVVAEDAILQRDDNFVTSHAGIDGSSLDAPFAQVAYLVLHQCDEWSYDQA